MNQPVNILIAEDSPTQAEQLRFILEQQGYNVSAAVNGREALQRVTESRPTVVISDIVMPEMTGYELCRAIKRDPNLAEIPVILLTSLSDPKDVIGGLECGADSFIVKPYDRRHLIYRVQNILTNRQLHRRESVQMGVELYFGGQKYFITADRLQILSLLVSTYEAAVEKNNELLRVQEELRVLNEELERKVEERTAALRESLETQRNLAEIVEASDDAIVRIDLAGIIQQWNGGARETLGHEAQDVIGRPLAGLVTAGRETEWEAIFQKIHAHLRIINLEMNWVHKDGTLLQMSLSISPIRNDEGKTVGAAVIARDVTDLKTLELQLRQAQKMEAIGQLAGGVAHDFNNLLQVIIGYANSAAISCADNPEAVKDLEEVVGAGERAAELTQQLLIFGRRKAIQPKDLDCNELIENLLKMMRRLLGEHLALDFIPGHELGTVYADPGHFDQILMNLCINARDAMPGGGTLTIETQNVVINGEYRRTHPWAREGRYVLLTVSDTGCGMDEETMNHIYEPFFTTKQEGKGTGLGLATVYGIVKQHNGFIHVYSEIDKGTVFKIYLPIVNRRATAVSRKVDGPIAGGSETILVAEDSESVRRLLVRLLTRAGYKTLEASDGAEAIQIFEANRDSIDLIIMDVVMPRLQGRDAYERVKAIKPGAKVLFSSGYSPSNVNEIQTEDLRRAMLQKPYDPNTLLRKVREVLDGPPVERG